MLSQVSIISFFEQYTMGIPLFAPSHNFLTQLHLKYSFVHDMNLCDMCGGKVFSPLTAHPEYNGSARIFINGSLSNITLDPNEHNNYRVVRHWLSFADYYTMPHVVHFESMEHLVDVLQQMWQQPFRLQAIHEAMRQSNRERLKALLRYWRRRLLQIAELLPQSQRPE